MLGRVAPTADKKVYPASTRFISVPREILGESASPPTTTPDARDYVFVQSINSDANSAPDIFPAILNMWHLGEGLFVCPGALEPYRVNVCAASRDDQGRAYRRPYRVWAASGYRPPLP